MQYVIGVDIGTQSTKAVLVDSAGTVLFQRSQSYRPDTPRPLWAEQWPQVWVDAVTEASAGCVRDAVAAGIDAASIKSLCISGLYGGAGIPVGNDMQALYPCLIWMDRRATEEVAWVRRTVDVARLQTITGNGVDSYYGFTKMLWIRQNKPEIWGKTRYFLPPNAFVIYQLTGEIAVDHCSAGNIGGVYDIAQRDWSDEALDMLGIPATMMPERLVEASEIVGGLSARWAETLGLPIGTPVVAGGVDAAVATFAAGVTRHGQHVAMMGTSMCWGYLSQDVDAAHGLVGMPYVFNGRRDNYVFGGAIAAGASVTWFRERFCQTASAAAATAAGPTSEQAQHQALEMLARHVPPGADGVVYLPYLMGERSPIWDANASGAFVGLSYSNTQATLYRAVLEGVAFALRHNIEAGKRGAIALDERLIVVGGATHSDLWMQIIADITGFPVFTIKEDVEAALGAALLAALAVGLATPAQAETGWVTLIERARPIEANRTVYAARFDVYQALYPALKPFMHRLRETS